MRVSNVALAVLIHAETVGGAPSPPDLASLARAAGDDGDGPLAVAVAERLTAEAIAALGPRAAAGVEADLLRAVRAGARGADRARPAVVAALDALGLGDAVPALDAELAAAAAREEEEARAAAEAAAAARAAQPAALGEESEVEDATV